MDLFKGIQLPSTPAMKAVQTYLQAQHAKDFSNSAEFFADDVVFHGLILKAAGRVEVAGEMEKFIKGMIEYIRIEAITEPEPGRVLALYWFKLAPLPEPQVLCDHIVVDGGKIKRIENVFDLRKLPPM